MVSLVAGGAGFIGSHLCKRLLDENHIVICVDNFITGNKQNIEPLLKNPQFTILDHDITVEKSKSKPKIPKTDYIFHLASPASPNKNSPRSYMSYPLQTLLVNSYGTYQLLELAKEDNARFLFASTSEIYGDPKESPQRETYFGNVNPNGVRSVYDESKRFGEAITMSYFRQHKVDTRIMRIFNTYGGNMQKDDGRVISNFINQALEGNPLTVYGKGDQTRSFCYIDDMIDGIIKIMFTDEIAGEVINIGNPEEYPILDIAKKIQHLTGTKSEIVFQELPVDDPMQRCPDITKAKELLEFSPKVGLDAGLKKTIEYFKQA